MNLRSTASSSLRAAGATPPEAFWLPTWHAFIKTVELGSMAAAARALDCTRAQVSRQMAELEAQLGARLLERSTRRLRPTPAGEVFLQHARQALDSVAATQTALGQQEGSPRGVLRISATITFGRIYVAPLLPALLAAHPQLVCELILTDQLVDLVQDQIDLALRMTRNPPQDAVARRIAPIERGVFAAPDYLAAHGVPASVPDLARHQTLSYLLTDDDHWRLQDAGGTEHRLPTTSRLRLNSTDALLDAALAGLGLTILPAYLAAPHVVAGRLQRVLPQVQAITPHGNAIYACYTPSRVRSPKVRVLLDALHARFEPVPPWERGVDDSKQPNAEGAKDSQRAQKTSTQMLSKR